MERAKKARESVLVLLTTDYPGQYGDYSFLKNEIDEVAATFDQVVLFSFRPVSGEPAQLPANVSYAGALTDSPRALGLRAVIQPGILKRVLGSLRREIPGAILSGVLRLSVGNIFTGVRFAVHIEDELASRDISSEEEVCVYSFWGSHGAMGLPFLPGTFRKVLRLHRFDLYEDGNPHLPLRASLFATADKVVPISEDGREYLIATYGSKILDPKKVVVSRLGTKDRGEAFAKDDGGGDSKDIRIVSCSSVAPVKRVETIIPALELLARQAPVQWTHFGGGSLLSDLEAAAASATKDAPKLEIRTAGWVQNERVLDHLASGEADVFVNVSDSEGVPVSIMEALSFGIPVVATDAGGTREVVGRELGSGVLLPLQPSPEALADAILDVKRGRAGTRARGVWEKMSNADQNAKHIATLLHEGTS